MDIHILAVNNKVFRTGVCKQQDPRFHSYISVGERRRLLVDENAPDFFLDAKVISSSLLGKRKDGEVGGKKRICASLLGNLRELPGPWRGAKDEGCKSHVSEYNATRQILSDFLAKSSTA